jgi:hypothetical protein
LTGADYSHSAVAHTRGNHPIAHTIGEISQFTLLRPALLLRRENIMVQALFGHDGRVQPATVARISAGVWVLVAEVEDAAVAWRGSPN